LQREHLLPRALAHRDPIGDRAAEQIVHRPTRLGIEGEEAVVAVAREQPRSLERFCDAFGDSLEERLTRVTEALRGEPNLRAEIANHTDSTGDAAYNQRFSQERPIPRSSSSSRKASTAAASSRAATARSGPSQATTRPRVASAIAAWSSTC